MSYDPESQDAMFARILERMDSQDRLLEEIKTQVYKTNGRVTALEQEKWFQRGVVAVITVSATVLWEWLTGHNH
jgi:hypothetical protein